MSTQENELSDGQERVGLKRKLTGPPRLLLGKSKSKEKLERKSQRRQRACDGTTDNNDQENNDSKANESSHNTHNSPQKASEDTETKPEVPEDTSGIIVTLEESENKDENIARKLMTRRTSKASIKRTFSSLLRCGKMKESNNKENETWNPKESKKNRNSVYDNMCENKLSETNNKEVPNGKWKKKAFFTLWPISKKFATSNVGLSRGYKEQGSGMDFQETAAPKGLAFKKIYRIFSRKKKTPSIDQFECSAPSASQNEVDDQMDQSSAAAADQSSSSLKREENSKENLEMEAESVPEVFTFSVEVSVNTNIESRCTDEEQICPDQDVSMNKEETQGLQNSGLMDSEVLPSSFSGCNIVSDLPSTSSGGDLQVLNQKPIVNNVKCRPVITIEHAYSSDEENVNESPQVDGLTVNGSWQHLKINGLTNNTLHPSDLHVDHSQCNESLLIQTAISMVQAAIRGAVEQLTIEQQHNQISLDHA